MANRQQVLSLKVTVETRRMVEVLAAKMTLKTGKRHTLTDIVTEAIERLYKAEKS